MKDSPSAADGALGNVSHLRVALVVSTYHEFVTSPLREGAVRALEHVGVAPDRITLIPVPGAFEVPFAARQAAESTRFDAIVCLGCVIRGETPHFDYIASAVAHGITTASQATGVPMSFGILTTNSREEAVARAGPGQDNKGWEAALAAVQLASVMQQLARDGRSPGDQ